MKPTTNSDYFLQISVTVYHCDEVSVVSAVGTGFLTLILLTWAIWRASTNASKWRMGFNPYPANVDNMASSYQC